MKIVTTKQVSFRLTGIIIIHTLAVFTYEAYNYYSFTSKYNDS